MLLALHVGFRRVLKLLEALEVWLLGVKIILFRVRTADHARDSLGHLGSKLQLLDLVLTRTTQLEILGIHIWARCSLGWRWGFCMLLIGRLVKLPVTLKEGSIRVFDTRRRVLLKRLWWARLLRLLLLDVLGYGLHLGGGRLLGHHFLIHGAEALRSGTETEGFACADQKESRPGQLSAITISASLTGKCGALEVVVPSSLRISGRRYPEQRRGDAEARRQRALHLLK